MRRRVRRPQGVHAPEPLPRSHGRRDPPGLVPPCVPAPSRRAHPAGDVRRVRAAVLGTCQRRAGAREPEGRALGVVDVRAGISRHGHLGGRQRPHGRQRRGPRQVRPGYVRRKDERNRPGGRARGWFGPRRVRRHRRRFRQGEALQLPVRVQRRAVQGVQGPRVARHVRPVRVRRRAGVHRGRARPRGAAVCDQRGSMRRGASGVRAPAGAQTNLGSDRRR
mmetsp:Transcript_6837/g.28348  ORF Transcript_6837/g.28348 Transcript_6837/m.28348 type:complete len:221 (+) Transcript_6837:1601-2263(+)